VVLDIGNGFAVQISATQLASPTAHVESLGALSRGLVHLMRERAGRGPTVAKSFWAGDDALLVLFGGGYTKAEQTLWDQGRPDTAVAYRHAVLDALEDGMREVVESCVGRPVVAVLATAHHDPDVMAVVFLLEPAGRDSLLEPLGGSGSDEAGRWGAGDAPASHSPQHARTDAASASRR
jgi:uncharacterized protein YbcI